MIMSLDSGDLQAWFYTQMYFIPHTKNPSNICTKANEKQIKIQNNQGILAILTIDSWKTVRTEYVG